MSDCSLSPFSVWVSLLLWVVNQLAVLTSEILIKLLILLLNLHFPGSVLAHTLCAGFDIKTYRELSTSCLLYLPANLSHLTPEFCNPLSCSLFSVQQPSDTAPPELLPETPKCTERRENTLIGVTFCQAQHLIKHSFPQLPPCFACPYPAF